MSASLVGSEMCIRDSVPSRSQDRDTSGFGDSQDLFVQSSGHEPMSGSVSYTHLTLPTICSV
eukprot:2268214-Alexandrium_andersonii.AAC.1